MGRKGAATTNTISLQVSLRCLLHPAAIDSLAGLELILEINAKSERVSRVDQWQVIKYFAETDCPVALWINFGRQRLEYHRLFPPKEIVAHRQSAGEAEASQK